MSNTSRRAWLMQAAALGLGAGFVSPRLASAATLEPSWPMDLGPFYPVEKPLESDADLTRLDGHAKRAQGQVVELTGRILAHDGTPVPRAKIEIWQANSFGRYHHHGDGHDTIQPDPDFQGYALQEADDQGRFRFLTVKPGAYPAGSFMRSPHVHFDVQGRYTRLVTQMYYPNEPLLGQDKVLKHDLFGHTNPMPANIFGALTPGGSTLEPGAALCRFDIVLGDG
ncbi:dioxygenase family protein [Phenylobacterium montanum]|uniref:Intradiol ring-cleavage dioxygenases domain-containing protein n=1 Tax=Phenylobacterium montanum TaxID=2823693 RepID=A0A975FW30_9CAUL|nr:hypothetical protein [Caulobacter sp. S6]QUD86450.1 hypothetical protein KCG34_15275 [Caulobacter sp. S6]